MKRGLYVIPYVSWLIISILLVSFSLFKSSESLVIYCIYSILVALILEIIRNRILNQNQVMNGTRITIYLIVNIFLGIPLIPLIMLSLMPLRVPIGFERYSDIAQFSWQQYLLLGYVLLIVLSNLLILKPSKMLNIAMFLLAPVIMYCSSLVTFILIK